MRLEKSEVKLLPAQEPGIQGMMKRVEQAGRCAYKSESRITESSWEKFCEMLYKRGHHAVFEQGTVYMKIPYYRPDLIFLFSISGRFTKMNFRWNGVYITTNYRLICQLGLHEVMASYWEEPGKYHAVRVSTWWKCSRVISSEILRHRLFSPVQESTRYVNYGKKGGGLTFIIPQWIYELRDKLAGNMDTRGQSQEYLKDLEGQELWNTLTTLDRTVASRDNLYMEIESQYLFELSTEESHKLKPENARGSLGFDIKTELYLTGFVDDFKYMPEEGSKEKVGFFNLRCAPDCHRDFRVLAEDLRTQFKENGY